MKVIRMLIPILLMVLLATGGYYLYLIIKVDRPLKDFESESTLTAEVIRKVSSISSQEEALKTKDYYMTEASKGPINLEGTFQAIDPVEKKEGNISYAGVLGVVDQNTSFSRVWLTENEYSKVKKVVVDNKILLGHKVSVTIMSNGVELTKLSP